MKSSNKVLVIGLDAAEPSLIEKWMDEGYLKTLASLRAHGSYCRLDSSADWLAGSPWPTFYTGTMPDEHGIYHYLQWRSDKMDFERPGPDWITVKPFWRLLGNDYKVIAVDIPFAFPPEPFNGIEISGWASHDRIFPPGSFPEDKIKWVINKFGKPPISDEVGGLQSFNELMCVKEELLNSIRIETELITHLMETEEWNLFLCCLTAPHRGGHKFWDVTNIKGEFSKEEEIEFKNSLRDIYQSCDDAVGKIINSAGEDVSILIFSLHGMGANSTLADKMLPGMLNQILNSKSKKTNEVKNNLLTKIRNSIPLDWRSNIRGLLPTWLQDKMTAYWRMGGINWSATKIFNFVADLQGYIRINLKGREKNGIVEQGNEYNNLCNHLIKDLMTYKDFETAEPVIENIKRKDELFAKGKGFDNLPDILVNWKYKPASKYIKIISSEFGELQWPSPGLNPDGRSGNHRPQGFLLASGKKLGNNSTFKIGHIIDLVPAILNLLETNSMVSNHSI